MNTGIQDAYNLAWKMAFVIKGYASEKLLDTYNEERLPNAQRLLETTDRAFNVLVGSHWLFSLMRMKILPLVAKYAIGRDLVGKNIFSAISQIRLNYRKNSLSQHDGDKDFLVKAGDRMPYFLVDGESIYDRLHAPKCHLLVFSDSEHGVRDLRRELEQESIDSIEFKVIPLSPQISEIFGTNRPFQLLLRPDNYIGFTSTVASLNDLRIYIHDVIGYPRSITISSNS
jgi:FAD binding domain